VWFAFFMLLVFMVVLFAFSLYLLHRGKGLRH